MTTKMGVISNWDTIESQLQYYRDHLDVFI